MKLMNNVIYNYSNGIYLLMENKIDECNNFYIVFQNFEGKKLKKKN